MSLQGSFLPPYYSPSYLLDLQFYSQDRGPPSTTVLTLEYKLLLVLAMNTRTFLHVEKKWLIRSKVRGNLRHLCRVHRSLPPHQSDPDLPQYSQAKPLVPQHLTLVFLLLSLKAIWFLPQCPSLVSIQKTLQRFSASAQILTLTPSCWIAVTAPSNNTPLATVSSLSKTSPLSTAV